VWWWWRRWRRERRTGGRQRRGRGLAEAGPGLPYFFLFFSFFCAVSIWVAHGKERVMPSRWGRPSTPFLCRASHVAHDKDLCRVLPFPTPCKNVSCARAVSARHRLCHAGSGLCHAPVAHGKACVSGSVPSYLQNAKAKKKVIMSTSFFWERIMSTSV
jgi:hypothetical protein